MPWGEEISVTMEVGFPVRFFTIGSTTAGVIGGDTFIGGTLIGDEVAPYVQQISTNRGRPDQLAQFTAGSASITLWNGDRRFDPINEASPYWDASRGRSGVEPRRKVRIVCDGEPIFVGRITDIDVSYSPSRPSASSEDSTVTISAVDDFSLLASTYIETDLTPTEEFSGARVSSILDLGSVDFPPTQRDISTGTAVLGGGAPFMIEAGTNALTYLQDIATAEQGYLFIDRFGDLRFGDRILPTFANIVASFSDDGMGLPYSSLDVIVGSEFLYNRVVCTTIDGTDQVADDTDSQDEYGISTLSLDGLILKDDAAALELAGILLDRYARPEYRFDRLRTLYNGRTAGERTTLTQIEIGEEIEITRSFRTGTPATVTKAYSIEGIRHSITPEAHDVTFSLASAEILFPFIIGDPVFGIIGTTNAIS